jgi:hypothetical protein
MRIRTTRRRRITIEGALAAITGFLTILTLITREWIEALTGWDPDKGNGTLELLVVVVLLAATIVLSLRARADWRRLRTLPT